MKWLLNKIKERDVRENLVRILAARNSDDDAEARIRDDVAQLEAENALGLLQIIVKDPKYQTDISIGLTRMRRKYFYMNPRMTKVVEHFDYAVGLGIEYPLDVIDGALGNMDNIPTTPEQEKALIRLEEARFKQPNATPGKRPEFPSFVIDAVLAKPQDIDKIIAVVINNHIEREAQFEAILDGTVVSSLSEGVL